MAAQRSDYPPVCNIVDSEANDSELSSFTFFVLSDFGNPTNELKEVAGAMHAYANANQRPSMVLGLGDNFYPRGVYSADDPEFKTNWSDIFLQYDTLRVPWSMVLGNHDYGLNPQAQVDFTYSDSNPTKLWKMPYNYYNFRVQNADFFALDTNGCQGHVRRSHPGTIPSLHKQVGWLDEHLSTSKLQWKFVFGHHPMYTKGLGHGAVADCLREESYLHRNMQLEGFGLENVVKKTERVVYLSGHEHVFQHHLKNGVQHVLCGNSGAEVREGAGFYGGENEEVDVDWYDKTNTYGFVSIHVTTEEVSIDFVDSTGNSFKQVVVDGREQTTQEKGEIEN